MEWEDAGFFPLLSQTVITKNNAVDGGHIQKIIFGKQKTEVLDFIVF